MLHINNGNGTFSEIGQIAGIAATDWSWSPVFADFNNDGWKDLLITNGYLRDYTNLDFLRSMDMFIKGSQQLKRTDVLHLVNQMPETELYNYIFQNNKNSTFTRINEEWGLAEGSYSNGAVYVDLDNDGDLEIVTNNINKPVFVYENKSNEISGNTYLKVKLKGTRKNIFGHGAKVYVYADGGQQMLEQQPARGYQSSVSPILHFGLGDIVMIDSVKVIWLGGMTETIQNIQSNQTIEFFEENAKTKFLKPGKIKTFFEEIASPIPYRHVNYGFNDFKRQPLMLNAKSFEGPCMAKADVNGDGMEDIFVGGGSGQAGAVFLQSPSGFRQSPSKDFDDDKDSDDVDVAFFDANNDGHVDLFVCSGGYHNFTNNDQHLSDRLYMNNGNGVFFKSTEVPELYTSSSCVAVCDINQDEYMDLFTGGFVVPGRYPEIPVSRILINDGRGGFKDQTEDLSVGLERIGMVSDAEWCDLDNDGSEELILVGQWMPVTVFSMDGGLLKDKTMNFFDRPFSGFWNTLLVEDMNNDEKPDLVVGNLGLNSQMQAFEEEPADLYYKDFDNNGSIDPIICFYILGESYPYVTRKELIAQIPRMAQKFPTFGSYADATIYDIFTSAELNEARHLQANHAKTTYFEQTLEGKFIEKSLPIEVQYAPVFTINALDYNKDGYKDLLLCGNINHARIRIGKYDANYGLLLKGDGSGDFSTIVQYQSGFALRGDVRSTLVIKDQILFGINGQGIKAYRPKP
jgi:hypothetical protein